MVITVLRRRPIWAYFDHVTALNVTMANAVDLIKVKPWLYRKRVKQSFS